MRLLPLLNDEAPRVRAAALLELGAAKGHEADRAVVLGLQDPDPIVRLAALQGFGRRSKRARSPKRILDQLHDAVLDRLKDDHQFVRLEVLRVLWTPNDDATLKALWSLVRSGRKIERVAAIKTLARGKVGRGTAFLSNLVTDPDAEVRQAAIAVVDRNQPYAQLR